jgi:hypothetical protein
MRNGAGQYTAPTSSFNPAINGVLATAGDWSLLLADIVAALTQSVSRDGQSPMTGNLPMGNNKVTGLAPGTGTGEALAFQQLFSQGTMADIASTATMDIGVQNTSFLRVTGTTTITSLGSNFRGPRFLTFEGAVTLTHSSTLVLPGGANITTAAGDSLIVIPGATLGVADRWVVVAYQSAPFNPSTAYTKSEVDNFAVKLTGDQTIAGVKTFESSPVVPDATESGQAVNKGQLDAVTSVGSLRAWVNFDGTTSPGTIRGSGNVSSVTRNGTGDYTVNFTTAMPDANYSLGGSSSFFAATPAAVVVEAANSGGFINKTTGSCRINTWDNSTDTLANAGSVNAQFFR